MTRKFLKNKTNEKTALFSYQKIYILFQATEPTLIPRPHNSYKRWEFLNKKPQAKYKLDY